MEKRYNGPEFRTLPGSIRDRIEAAVMAAQETVDLRINLRNYPKGLGSKSNWNFGDAKEVFVYDLSTLRAVNFRTDVGFYELSFFGGRSGRDGIEIEKALGLRFIKRPAHSLDSVQVMVEDQPLERLAKLGHISDIVYRNSSAYQCTPSGPYLAKY